jgi:ABC-type glutathione transport system ATPase component
VSEPVVQVTDLVKRYGEIEAVRGINFAVTAGETFGFLGPNGAGRSTTIKILCTVAAGRSLALMPQPPGGRRSGSDPRSRCRVPVSAQRARP